MNIDIEAHKRLIGAMAQLRAERDQWTPHWQELAKMYLPRRYRWLERSNKGPSRNDSILDNTGTLAARTLASGMMNGITNPARQWFNLRMPKFDDEEPVEVKRWLYEVRRRMLVVMGSTNFYNAMAVLYLDLVLFGTAAVVIYQDYESVFRCYNCAMGEYFLGQSDRLQVNTFGREFRYTLNQIVARWGLEALTDAQRSAWDNHNRKNEYTIFHLIEPVIPREGQRHRYVETHWCEGSPSGTILERKVYYEFPCITPRWDVTGNDSYGQSPGMDAFGDVMQLQHETKRKGQALDILVKPPLIADIQLKNRPTALIPGGLTFVSGMSDVGVKPAYQINPPINELTLDIREIQGRIRETFHNDLFRMISQLETVRSATEIDARREEKLVLLGPVLERFENEALSPAINRVFAIMGRAGLLPPAPEQVEAGDYIEIQYVSILSDAQKAVATIPIERFLNILGPVSSFSPDAKNVAIIPELLIEYANSINVPPAAIRSREEILELAKKDQQMQEMAQQAEIGNNLAGSAKLLSETDVGGGVNALTRVLGG